MPTVDRLPWWQNAWRLGVVWVSGVVFGLLVYAPTTLAHDSELRDAHLAMRLLALDLVVMHLIVVLVAFRRRWPVTVTLGALALSAVSPTSVPVSSLAVLSLATRRRPAPLAAGVVLNILAGLVHERWIAPHVFPPGMEYTIGRGVIGVLANAAIGTLFFAVFALVGWNIGSRRELVRSWRAQAATAVSEQAARVAQARLAERARIAREMHDVLAHRLSLVAMHAGVLAHRTDLSEAERQEAAEVVRAGAHQALQELREVLGVLREDGAVPEGSVPVVEAPQPGISDLPSLAAEVTSNGHPVRLDTDPELWARSVTLPAVTGRHAYRVVQEALTNARKHAPGRPVTVRLRGRAGEGLTVVASNPLGAGSGTPIPSGGRGLTGMAERVQLVGGRFEAGPEGADYVVRAWFPWPEERMDR